VPAVYCSQNSSQAALENLVNLARPSTFPSCRILDLDVPDDSSAAAPSHIGSTRQAGAEMLWTRLVIMAPSFVNPLERNVVINPVHFDFDKVLPGTIRPFVFDRGLPQPTTPLSRSEKSARVEAFLRVPLFAQAFGKFGNHPLPPAAAIESQMEQMGVTPKQTDKARQVFIRSARFAGFFELAGDRLVKPSINGPPEASIGNGEVGETDSSEPPENPPHHPFVEGLLRELPDPETEWKLERRVKWLRTAANIFDMIYEDSEQSREIQINIRQEDAPGGGVQ